MRFVLVIAAAALLVSCSSPKQQIKVEPSKPTKPEWITKLPKRAGYMYVVGVKSRAKSLEEGKAGAHENATVQVSQFVGTQIQSESESRMSTDGENFASDAVAAQTAAFIKALQQEDEYYEKTTKMIGSYYEEGYDVWMLASFPLNAADDERKRQAMEQAEMTRDAFKRYQDALAEKGGGNQREAWLLIAKARQILKSVPKLTEIHEGKFDTAADLLRAVEKDLRSLDELAHGVRVDFAPGDGGAKKVKSSFTSHLSSALSKTSLILRTDGDARFVLKLDYTTKRGSGKVMGQNVGHLAYSGNVKDTWSGASLSGTSGEVKGFGKSFDGAFGEAASEAAEKIAKTIAKQLNEALEAELASAS